MKSRLHKVLVTALAVSLIGCSSTKYTAQPIRTTAAPIPSARITLVNGSTFEVENLEITDYQVSGRTVSGVDFQLSRADIESIEIGNGKIDPAKSAGAAIFIPLVILFFLGMFLQASCSISGDTGPYSLCN